MEIIFLPFAAIVLFIVYKVLKGTSFKSDGNSFEQGGVRVVFDTGKITIKGNTYDVKDVQGIETHYISKVAALISFKVDDFKKPIQKVKIYGLNGGDKFVQRLSTALRKAGGKSFY